MLYIWLWVNTYRYIFSGMNIHLPAILGFTRYQGFDPSPYFYRKKIRKLQRTGWKWWSKQCRAGWGTRGRLPRSQTDAMDAGEATPEATPAPAEWADDTPVFSRKPRVGMARWDIFFSTKVLSSDDWNGNFREIFSNYSPTKCYPFFEKVGEWWRFRVGKSSQLGINISWHYPVSTIRPNSFSIVFFTTELQ